jgi:thymidylate synthase
VSMIPETEGLQEAIHLVLGHLLAGDAAQVHPRGLPTQEVMGATVKIANPRKRLIIRPARQKWSVPFAMGEYLWYMRGENRLETMAYYAPRMRIFSDDQETLNSAYGHRIFGHHEFIGFDQWEAVKRKIHQDPDSRQAIMHIRVPHDTTIETKDHPCTVALQFLQRGGKLNLIAMMRSNDIILGTPYDIFSFTMMLEQMALELGLDLGSYIHQVGSWHLYARQKELAEEMLEITKGPPAMPKLEHGISGMIDDEERIRNGQQVGLGAGYWRDWRLVLSAFAGQELDSPGLHPSYERAWQMSQQRRSKAA